jgi:hypothetical protein
MMVDCASCGEPIRLEAAQELSLRRSRQTFYCLWGHQNYFPAGKTEAEKAREEAEAMRRERDKLKQNTAYLEDRLKAVKEARDHAERRAAAARGQVTRLKNRAAAGVCPCCNRSFENLRRHMQARHKGFALEETAPIGTAA